ncbi:hypothetical protein CDAR_546211 [Caerostris darwini]|uniref:Uncharacterized protein n=1 Tax=Caerostris darwini TaxID=1538125 RepID=A0AAV4VDH0_9ARAC|nr:hypothetical protein CDAR_546211 [Caerostris darwini]
MKQEIVATEIYLGICHCCKTHREDIDRHVPVSRLNNKMSSAGTDRETWNRIIGIHLFDSSHCRAVMRFLSGVCGVFALASECELLFPMSSLHVLTRFKYWYRQGISAFHNVNRGAIRLGEFD